MPRPIRGDQSPPPKKHPDHHPLHSTSAHGQQSGPTGSNTGNPAPANSGGVTGANHGPPAWVIRRQQVLRRAGFNISVDGVWGAASQHAWESFTKSLTPAQHDLQQKIIAAQNHVPPGMARVDGRLVTQQQARMIHQITRIQNRAAAATPAVTNEQLATIQRNAARTGHPGPTWAIENTTPVRGGKPPLQVRQRLAKQDRKTAIAQQNADVNAALSRIVGVGGQHQLMNHNFIADAARAGRIDVHDLALLMRHGYIDPRDAASVRAIQSVIDHHLPTKQRVALSGVYDSGTDHALKTLFATTAARDFKAQLESTRKRLFVTGVAQSASLRALGHKITDPATLIRILQRGGPDAARLSRALAAGYERHVEDVAYQKLVKMRLKQVTGIAATDSFSGNPFDPKFILNDTPSDRILANAGSLRDYARLEQAYIRNEQVKQLVYGQQAKHSSSWWQEGLSSAGSALSYPVSKVEGVVFATQYFVAGAHNDLLGWIHKETGLDTSGARLGISDGANIPSYLAGQPAPGEWRSPDGYTSWHKSWQEGQITLGEMNGWERLAFDIALDPLNLVGAGLETRAIRGGLGLAILGSTRAVDIIDKVAPKLTPELEAALRASAYKTTEGLIVLQHAHPVATLGGWTKLAILGNDTRRASMWAKATTTRAIAIDRVNAALREAFVASLRPIVVHRVAGQVESKLSALGAGSDSIARLVDPAIRGEMDATATAARESLPLVAPAFTEAITSIKTSLYSTYARTGGVLSLTGRRVFGFLEEYASRSILDRYALTAALRDTPLDLGPLNDLSIEEVRLIAKQHLGEQQYLAAIEQSGSWAAGGVPLDWREAYFNELRLFTDRIEKQLLPGLDELMRLRHGDSIWAQLGDTVPTNAHLEVPTNDRVPTPPGRELTGRARDFADAGIPEPIAQQWADFLSSEEARVGVGGLDEYVASSASLNSKLRAVLADNPYDLTVVDLLDSREAQIFEGADRAIAASPPLAEDVVLYRGQGLYHIRASDGFNLKPGDKIEEPAFLSTSTDAKVADNFGSINGPDAVMMMIRVPRGTRVRPLHDMNLGEAEVLLPRGGTLHVTAVHDHPQAVVVEADYVADPAWIEAVPTTDVGATPVLHVAQDSGRVAAKLGLLDEGGIAIRDALDRFFGYSVEEAYNPANYVKIKNPNFDRAVSNDVHLALAHDEIDRLTRSYDGWVEMHTRVTGEAVTSSAVAAKHASIRKAVTDAWKQDGKLWKDTREFLHVPAPLARTLDPAARSAAHAEGGRLADLFTNFDRIPTFQSVDASAQVKQAAIGSILKANPWETLATTSVRLEALHALAESQLATKLYFQNGLILAGLRTHEARAMRATYYILTAGLNSWKAATLPFRPAFFVRNVVDNYFKAMVQGLRDPRLFFNSEGRSLWEMVDARAMRAFTGYFDAVFGSDVRGILDHLHNKFWLQPDSTINKIFGAHGIEIPSELRDYRRTIASMNDKDQIAFAPSVGAISGSSIRRALPNAAIQANDWRKRFADNIWELMASRPENLAKRQLYVSRYRQELARTGDEMLAAKNAMAVVEKTLFDYDKITVLEDQLKVIAPFIFFWRKNAQFWGSMAVDKPWFFLTADKAYVAHENGNADLPDWMRRYVNLAPVASLTDAVGFSWASRWLRDGSNFDPLNYISFVQFYKAFKGDNPNLAPDKQGWGFVSNVVDGLNSVGGLGINPFWSEAGQRLGILNRWSWRDIYPGTTVLQAITNIDFVRKSFGVDTPGGFNVEDWLLDPIFKRISSEPTGQQLGIDRFNFYVQQEMAGQVAAGEPANRSKAEAKIRGFIVFQTLMGFAIGIYPRRISQDDLAIYQINALRSAILNDPNLTPAEQQRQLNAEWFGLSPQEQEAYRLFAHRGYNPAAFDRYRIGIEAARAFFQIDDPAAQQQFLIDHPEVLPIINPVAGGRTPSETYLQTQLLLARTDAVFQFSRAYLDGIDAAGNVKQAAYDTLVTPSLRAFWAQNDTPAQMQERHMKGAYFNYINGVQNTYFGIPEGDYAARSDYLSKHPELSDWWARNDGATDDYRNLMQQMNNTFREVYFQFANAGDWNSADEFLRRHPFIFDFTSAEGRIDPNGKWLPKSQQQQDYAKVAADLRIYYALPESKRDDYARAHPLITWFQNKYAANDGLLAQARDYNAISGLLGAYFNLPLSAREAYLNRHPELRSYFAKYAQQQQASQHARDYLAVRGLLDQFFNLPQVDRPAFLQRHPELQAYFDKYSSGRNGHTGHSYEAAARESLAKNPDIALRYRFWQQLLALPPNKRAEFISKHADKAGVFIYGSLSYDWRQQQEKRWHRMALRLGLTDRSFLYERVAPLLDLYFSLPAGSGERATFLEVNPDVAEYLQRYSSLGQWQSPKLHAVIEGYFALPPFSSQRVDYLAAHPELKVYFNKNASPKEIALQAAVDAYFQLPYGPARNEYLARNPEVADYFNQRAKEHALFSSLAAAFNASDPRMAEFKKMYEDIIPLDAIHLWVLTHQSKHEIIQGPSRDQSGRRVKATKKDKLATRRDRSTTG